jgi:short-subunit dehydrogenase
MAAHQPIPGMAVYSASKAFVLNFTEALWHESRSTGLRVLALSPGLTTTEFFDVLGSDLYKGNYETPEQVVQTAMKALDRNRQPSVTSGRSNAFLTSAARLLTRRRAVMIAASFGSSSAAG